MSSARDSKKRRAAGGRASSRTSSIARSIALSIWGRRFVWFLVLDMLLVAAFLGTAIWSVAQDVPGGLEFASPADLFGAMTLRAGDAPGLAELHLVISRPDGNSYELALGPYLPFAIALGGTLLLAEALALISGFSEARRIRRKLRPLNDLALTAETIASRAGSPDPLTPNQLESLERAIEHATPDTPRISTGNKDLHSIEIALNSLLQRMREAQTQQARFVSDASHELRTPIAVIEGYVGMLDRWGKSDPAVLEESIEALKNESAHMKELVEQLLFLARGDSGRTILERSTFDAAELLEEVAAESRMIDAGHRYLVRKMPGDTAKGSNAAPALTADRAMVKQCLRTILQNAARYSPADTGIELRICRDKEGGFLGFSIEDQGIGMDGHDAEHVFERFYRSDAARGSSEVGTGLGLAIATWIAEAHGGRIDVLSCKGVGTRFTVWLPK